MFTKMFITIVALGVMMVTGISSEKAIAGPHEVVQPINQPIVSGGYILRDHEVIAGESVQKIARIYYGSEDLAILLNDNPWLSSRPTYSSTGGVIGYRLIPGDRVNVREYAQEVDMRHTEQQPTDGNTTSSPTDPLMWVLIGILFVALGTLIGFLCGERRNPATAVAGIPPITVTSTNTINPTPASTPPVLRINRTFFILIEPPTPVTPAPASNAPAEGAPKS